MVTRLRFAALLALVLPVSALLSGCGEDVPSNNDLGFDQGVFIACDVDMGTQTNSGCPKDLPMCHPFAHICVGCIPSSQTCLPGYECSPNSYVCLPIDPNRKCTRNVDCPIKTDGFDPRAIICNIPTGQCFQCVSDFDCVSPDGGGVGTCVQRLHICGDGCLECLPNQICDRANKICLDPDGGT